MHRTDLRRNIRAGLLVSLSALSAWGLPACAGDAPAWMRAQVNVPVPAHDENADAVLLYSEEILNVQGSGKIKTLERKAYKILRPGGKNYGLVRIAYDSETKINFIHAWC